MGHRRNLQWLSEVFVGTSWRCTSVFQSEGSGQAEESQDEASHVQPGHEPHW